MNGYDVVVVGNGVLGLSLATTLGLRSAGRIALVGDETRHAAATPAAGAMLGCFGEVTTSLLATPYGRAKLDLAVRARAMWPSWLAQLGELAGDRRSDDRSLLTAEDTVVVLNTAGSGEVDDGNFRAIESAARGYGASVEPLDVDKVAWLEPEANSRPLRALHLPGEGALNAPELLRRLERAAERTGVTRIRTPAERVDVEAGRVTGVTLRDGTVLGTRRLVLAAGARTGELLDGLPELRARVPLVFGGCGVSAVLDLGDVGCPPHVLRTPNRAFACGLHLVPRSARTVYVGATNGITFAPRYRPQVNELLALLTSASHQMHRAIHRSTVDHVRTGLRPMSIDGFPLIRPTRTVDGLWLLTGTYRDGLHLSPLLARHIAHELAGEPGLFDAAAFRPERELIQAFTRDQVVADVVRGAQAVTYEQRWQVPPGYPEFVAPMLTDAYQRLTGELSDVYTPPAEFLAALRTADPALRQRLRTYYAEVHRVWRSGS